MIKNFEILNKLLDVDLKKFKKKKLHLAIASMFFAIFNIYANIFEN